jgi:hypothetical protein
LTSATKADAKRLHNIDLKYSVKDVPLSSGLTSDEASRRLDKFGPNAVPDPALHPLRKARTKFWAPVPWMLEAAIVLEVALGMSRPRSSRVSWSSTPLSVFSRKGALRRLLPR